ncbi:MAG: cobaltochelatase subunit CobN [Proteobacteria bacterium]|nr:cobaltochelatase subunit CobN [Pseudomonadota bacterium]
MHLLATQPGTITDGSEAVDLGQSPGDIVVLSAADSELAALADAQTTLTRELGDGLPSLRLANLMRLGHNFSVDLYTESVIAGAKLVIVRLLGGRGYWPYGVEQLAATCRANDIPLALLPGDDQPDAELAGATTLEGAAAHRLWQYCVHGGPDNAANFLRFAASLTGASVEWREPAPLLRAGLYWPGARPADIADIGEHWRAGAPIGAILFYRALVQAANLAPIDALIESLQDRAINPLPIFLTSLRDPVAAAMVDGILGAAPPDVVLNATGFAKSVPGAPFEAVPAHLDCPVLQVIFAGTDEAAWRQGTRGLGPTDIAMNVALPEVDGRLIARAVSFKGRAKRSELCETDIVSYVPVPDRIDFTASLAAAWVRLRRTPAGKRNIAIVLANYPNRDGRIGNGVGLDTPASAVKVLDAMADAGYTVKHAPADGAELIARLLAGPTNAPRNGKAQGNGKAPPSDPKHGGETLTLVDYLDFFATLPETLRVKVTARWGPPEDDPFFRASGSKGAAFAIAAYRCGRVAICLQPARGYNIDPQRSYHDPALVPPHGYFAFYAWVRRAFAADAVIHLGKHGNLEWLPGKAVALSRDCFPEATLGPTPNLYPFIVNDPGEGTQAKRRAGAVIIDHLTPPLTRAESYGPLRDLEQLVDEYYEAAGMDPRRLGVLTTEILDLARRIGLDTDCGIAKDEAEDTALFKLDNYLCELKEMQIRDGLHIFGISPDGERLTDLLVALTRIARGPGTGNGKDDGGESLLRALGLDLGLDFDPLDVEMAGKFNGPAPAALKGALNGAGGPLRTYGDGIERLEALAKSLIDGTKAAPTSWRRTRAVLDAVETTIRPAVEACGGGEIAGLLAGLDGRFVVPGPSGAPTRGRPDVLPTGRNFYSVDTRTVPTPAAWHLGWKSAGLLVERYAQDHGRYPSAMALSAWGTSNMRTGGDDIAQALALLGTRPTWDAASRRVTGFEILPLSVIGRPRVDVTLRISGFFRDAFPALIDLFDSATRAVAGLDESVADNPLAARVASEAGKFQDQGLSPFEARRRAGTRVFGSMPGAYGAGLQSLIDERGWESEADLARAYLAWGGYAYGAGADGEAARDLFRSRLSRVEAVVQNQDNREHDLLDSDDYYQFEGGLAVAVKETSGTAPAVYHNDHSRPENPKIRTLTEEIARVVRARVVNPKWIGGVMRHGYKGAFEMAATVDYLFAFAATAKAVKDHHFDAVFDAYIQDDKVRAFLEDNNPAALADIGARLLEAQERGLWRPRANIAHEVLSALAAGEERERP